MNPVTIEQTSFAELFRDAEAIQQHLAGPAYRVKRSKPARNRDGSFVLDENGKRLYTKIIITSRFSYGDIIEAEQLCARIMLAIIFSRPIPEETRL